MTTVATTPDEISGADAGGYAARALGVTKRYGADDATVVALDDVTLGLPGGHFTAIMGPSGSGKSTLMHCLAGLDRVTAGQIHIGDIEITQLSDKVLTRLRRDRIGFIFQSFNLIPTLTALENITLPLDIGGRKPQQAWLDRLIDTVGLRNRLHHRPGELSGGQQQRVACARALASQPDIVFADEPTGNLDSRSGAELLSFLRDSVTSGGHTVVMVTHDPIAAAHADDVVFLNDGRIVETMADPTADRVLERMKNFEPMTAPAPVGDR
ncbi:ABC transporter ATP-binding protein [Actinoplanes sp. NEAU-A12]|uniref:ABC transporter ATP-binding protein n=1 Tax=Actinoplanes sandaracinus TaxID=3045177 RepID=A0ABT6WTD5_9ACTN|nr:ABC transporter ATP-binding protein [Actinoplanes sandaracinus]MDI6103015.1 ABC transporter ATP-binding protein [Actinoplanes sandaracinus]